MKSQIAKVIYEKVAPMPDTLAQEILDFIDFIAIKHENSSQEAIQVAQMSSLEQFWGDSKDDVWNNIKTY